MKELSKQYRKYGYTFDQVKREGDVCIYSQKNEESGKIVGYEVFEIQKKQAFEMNGHSYEASEAVPNSAKWGECAFTSGNLAAAEIRFKFLQDRILERVKK